MVPGTTIYVAYPGGTTPHLHVVVTEPFGNPEVVVLVNLSSCKGFPFEDRTTMIRPGDHPFVERESYIPYDYAKKVRLDVITRKLEERKAERREDLSEQLLTRITDGLMRSPRTPGNIKSLVRRSTSKKSQSR
jgi:hypothetical protein